jgi:threonine/homoserine/homoserine lactone efflux protein
MQTVLTALAAFVAAATLVTITPGLDTVLVLRTAAAEGPRRAGLSALGIVCGCLAWTLVVAIGLGALLAASQLAYTILKWAGAAYLVWLGVKMLRHPRTSFAPPGHGGVRVGGAAFARGLYTNLLNPKVGVFYVSFLPQFVPHGVAVGPFVLLLGAIHAVLGLTWFACLIAATRPIAGLLTRSGVVKTLDRLTGGVFVAFGVGLALEARRA